MAQAIELTKSLQEPALKKYIQQLIKETVPFAFSLDGGSKSLQRIPGHGCKRGS